VAQVDEFVESEGIEFAVLTPGASEELVDDGGGWDGLLQGRA
jgi:hypothetical protein